MSRAPVVFDLRQRRQHADAVADRIWKAFWRHHGTPFEQIRDGLGTSRRSLTLSGWHRQVLYARELGAVPSQPEGSAPWT